jgi:thiol:disulfide interchange protein DsbD
VRTKRTGWVAAILFVALVATLAGEGSAGKSWADKKPGGIRWTYNVDDGLAKAKKAHKPVMIDFMALWCPPCKAMEDSTFSSSVVIKKSGSFVSVRIDIDTQREVAAKYNGLARKYGGIGIPNILFLAEDGSELKHIVGYYSPDQLVAAMDSALALAK